jgi:hypothetical protein
MTESAAVLEQRNERLQTEIDRAREMLRSTGIEQFGELSDGLRAYIEAHTNPITKLECSVSHAELEEIDSRVRATAARLKNDEDYRRKVAVRIEVLRMVLEMVAGVVTWPDGAMLDALNGVEAQLKHYLRELEAYKLEHSKYE